MLSKFLKIETQYEKKKTLWLTVLEIINYSRK